LYNILEASELKAIVVNAQHMKAVPGRKTDVKDAEWIADLVQHGLLKASFIPNKDQRELRELVSYRKSLVGERTRELNRLQKMLEGANIKISGTVKDINGKSARNILEFILTGEAFDEAKYDEMYRNKTISHNLKASKEQIIADLNGVMSPLQRRMMKELLAHLDELNLHIKNLDDEIDNFMKPDEKDASISLQSIPGIGSTSAQAVVSVIGTDMERFPNAAHLASWAGLCPGDNQSAAKRKSGKTRKGNSLLRTTLITCAHSAVLNKESYFYAQFMRISAHRGKKRAYVAVAHSMLIAIYHMLKYGVAFEDLGADYYNQFNKERKINAYLKKLKALGWEAPAVAV
jgi:transposase